MKATLIAVLAGGLIALGAHAQVLPSTPAASFSESELKAFVSAAAEIQRINADFEGRVKAAETEQEQRELVIAASIQQNVAVSSRGLTAEKYQQIIERIDTDPAFAQRIEEQLKAQAR
jgi:diacylglycerol kinase family enzyme